MAEVFAQFPEPIKTRDGVSYRAQACAAVNADGLWEGWVEFIPVNGGPPLRSPRETTQPNRVDAAYWATGLTDVYLEGALARALTPPIAKTPVAARAQFDGPASPSTHLKRSRVAPSREPQAILDPFSVYDKGELILRQELAALSPWHLVNIIVAHELSSEPVTRLNRMSVADLIAIIVARVRHSPVQ